jgi:hypothetical protein
MRRELICNRWKSELIGSLFACESEPIGSNIGPCPMITKDCKMKFPIFALSLSLALPAAASGIVMEIPAPIWPVTPQQTVPDTPPSQGCIDPASVQPVACRPQG